MKGRSVCPLFHCIDTLSSFEFFKMKRKGKKEEELRMIHKLREMESKVDPCCQCALSFCDEVEMKFMHMYLKVKVYFC